MLLNLLDYCLKILIMIFQARLNYLNKLLFLFKTLFFNEINLVFSLFLNNCFELIKS